MLFDLSATFVSHMEKYQSGCIYFNKRYKLCYGKEITSYIVLQFNVYFRTVPISKYYNSQKLKSQSCGATGMGRNRPAWDLSTLHLRANSSHSKTLSIKSL